MFVEEAFKKNAIEEQEKIAKDGQIEFMSYLSGWKHSLKKNLEKAQSARKRLLIALSACSYFSYHRRKYRHCDHFYDVRRSLKIFCLETTP